MPQHRTRRNLPREADRLQDRRRHLIENSLGDGTGSFNRGHSRIIDEYFREGFESSSTGPRLDIIRNPYAIIALGGYGRQEQSLHSDIDLLFLFEKKVPDIAEDLIREIVYPLWDLGFEVGYATRSLKESIAAGRQDFEVLTSYLDARFICGVSLLYTRLLEQLRNRIFKPQAGKIVDWLIQRNLIRHQRFGDSAYLLEPNLKEGQGGLRDYHTIFWAAKIKFGFQQLRDFEYEGYFSHSEFQEFHDALHFIWNVRNQLHRLTGRKCDQLYLNHQLKLAQALGYAADGQRKPVERFLGELHRHMETVKQQHLLFLHDLKINKAGKPGRKPTKKTSLTGLLIDGGTIDFASSEQIVRRPLLLLEIFAESGRLKVPLSADARRLVREFAHLVDSALWMVPDALKTFERILSRPDPEFNGLDIMLQTGLLSRIIPEFAGIVNRIQYNEYHIYPVGRHALKTLQEVKTFGIHDAPQNDLLFFEVFHEIASRRRLYWAALLHDIGKGAGSGRHAEKGAAMVRNLLGRMNLRGKDIKLISSLVENHLLLIKTATRRNLNDEETAVACAHRVGNADMLKMLYLLTVADSRATGPKAWNSWTAVLLQDLFFKTLRVLESGELASRRARHAVNRKKEQVLAACTSPEARTRAQQELAMMSPRYLLYAPAGRIHDHLELYHRLGQRDFVWDIRKGDDAGTRRVTICAQDRPGLFSKIAGVLTISGVDILDAQIFTWRNNIALDVFEVRPPPDRIFEQERWGRAEKHLARALAGEVDIAAHIETRATASHPRRIHIDPEPHRVEVDNTSSSFFTIVEVFTYDFPGLLFRVTDALFRSGLDIWVAKIATKIDQVVDVFYVRDFDGQKVEDAREVAALKAAVLSVLPGFEPRATAQKAKSSGI